MSASTKTCTRCREAKSLEDFPRDKRRKDGRFPHCRPCNTANMRAWREANPEKAAELNRKTRERAKANGTWRRAMLRYKYGLTEAEVDEMREAQRGGCAICGEQERELVIDHAHDSGKVRGLLCGVCNRGLGMLGDDVEGLRRALAYLEERS